MITYGYDNFSHRNARGHMTTSTIWFESRDEILLITPWTQNYDVIIFTSNNFNLKRPKVANFAGIIKIATPFVQPASKDSKKT